MTYEEAIQYAKDIHFCTGCPIDMSIDGGESCKVCEHKAFFELAINAFEKQIAKPVKNPFRPFYCPNCGTKTKVAPYCWKCGQHIEYRGEEWR